MITLGISSDYHDSSASLVIDGQLKNLIYEDRFSYIKHDSNFPINAIDYCLKANNLNMSDIDSIAYYEDPIAKSIRQITTSLTTYPLGIRPFAQTVKKTASNILLKYNISKKLKIDENKIHFVPHHLSHASFAFNSSNYENAAIVVIDAVGEWITTSIWRANKNLNGQVEITPIEFVGFPNSLGLFYSTISSFLGFKVNDGECSTMALAAFGKPTFIKKINEIIYPLENGKFKLDSSFINFQDPNKPAYNQKLINLLGRPRLPFETIKQSCFNEFPISNESEKWADIACSTQVQLELILIRLFKRAAQLTGLENVCYTGGVALNCVANKKIIENMTFKNIFIPADPGDGGTSAGAAYYLNLLKPNNFLQNRKPEIYLGTASDLNLTKKTFNGVQNLESYESLFNKTQFGLLQFNKCDFYKILANKLAAGEIIGIVNGNAEIGPRSLGNRSIISRADSILNAKKISNKIKARAEFRPYACSLLAEDAEEYFLNYKSNHLSKWMQSSLTIKPNHIKDFNAVKHIDNSTRPQILEKNDNQFFYNLLIEYKKITGVSCILNTSFNESGNPMAKNGVDALIIWGSTPIDTIVVDDLIFIRNGK